VSTASVTTPVSALAEADFQFVAKLVREQAAIVLEAGKAYLVETRLLPVARKSGFKTIAELVAAVRAKPGGPLGAEVVDAMTTNETSFFRDVHPFDALKQHVIPDLIRRREVERKLNIWCAASSSGQEPFSMAILLREHFPQLRDWTVGFIASDLSSEMLAKCQAGKFNQLEVNRGLPAPLLVKHFQKSGTEWQIKDDIRRSIEFRQMNLARPWPAMPQCDLIMIRNVMIYFDTATKKDILVRCRKLLRPDGYLFLGAAETTLNIDDGFDRVTLGKSWAHRPKS
jgi:chemotaxis protein methyltransferase CheR